MEQKKGVSKQKKQQEDIYVIKSMFLEHRGFLFWLSCSLISLPSFFL